MLGMGVGVEDEEMCFLREMVYYPLFCQILPLHHRPVQLCRIFWISRDQVLSSTRTATHIVIKTSINKLFPWKNHENKFLHSRIPKKFDFSDVTKPLPREGRQGGLRWLFSNLPYLHLCIFPAKFLSLHVGFSSQRCCLEARFLLILIHFPPKATLSFSGVSLVGAFLTGTPLPAASLSEFWCCLTWKSAILQLPKTVGALQKVKRDWRWSDCCYRQLKAQFTWQTSNC